MNYQEEEWTVLLIFKNSLDKYLAGIIWLTHAWGKGRSLAIFCGSVYGELNFAIQLVYFSLNLAFDKKKYFFFFKLEQSVLFG